MNCIKNKVSFPNYINKMENNLHEILQTKGKNEDTPSLIHCKQRDRMKIHPPLYIANKDKDWGYILHETLQTKVKNENTPSPWNIENKGKEWGYDHRDILKWKRKNEDDVHLIIVIKVGFIIFFQNQNLWIDWKYSKVFEALI